MCNDEARHMSFEKTSAVSSTFRFVQTEKNRWWWFVHFAGNENHVTLLTNGGGIFIQANLVCAPSCVQKIFHVISVPIFSASKTTSSSSLGCRGSFFLVFFEEVACLECSVALARWTRWRRRCSPRRGKSRALSPGIDWKKFRKTLDGGHVWDDSEICRPV